MSQYPGHQSEAVLPEGQTSTIREQLHATTQLVDAAHDAPLREALDSVRWERRGPLRRLVRR